MKNAVKMAFLVTLFISLAAQAADFAQQQPDALPLPTVTIQSQSAPKGSTVKITAGFKLPKGMKIYKESVAFDFSKADGVNYEGAEFPPAEIVSDDKGMFAAEQVEVLTGDFDATALLRVTGQPGTNAVIEGTVTFQGCDEDICFLPQNRHFSFEVEITEGTEEPAPAVTGTAGTPITPAETPKAQKPSPPPATNQPARDVSGWDLLAKLALAFAAGLGIGFSPCGYPMIPITAAIIGAQKERGIMRSLGASLVYILGLAAVYSFIGVNVARAGASFRQYLDKPIVLLPIAGVFVIMAIALLRDINIGMPAGAAARLREKLTGRKSLIAIFLLGMVSAVFAGPCAVPFLGATLSYVATLQNTFLGFWIMFAVALGMGVPLVIAGTATGLLPKAGMWMVFIKRLMGFVLLWAAAYFLRGILGYKMYNVVTALLLVIAVVSLRMLDRPAADSGLGRRILFGTGICGVIAATVLSVTPFTQTPQQNLFTDAGIAEVDAAIASGKPVILDFYTANCTSCKELDRDVFTHPRAHAAVKGIAAFKINGRENELLKRYNVLGFPTVVFIEPGGNVRTDLGIIGYRNLDEFLELVEKFKAGR